MKKIIEKQTCHFLVQRAVYWEEQKTLIIADIHLGKATTFRKAGIFIPEGSMESDLENLFSLIIEWKPSRCIVVGDLIHAMAGLTEQVQIRFAEWLQKVPCEFHLVIGNHDKGLLKNFPEYWSFQVHLDSFLLEPFYFCHIPMLKDSWFVWSGHIHPKIELKNRHDRVVLRCFQIFPKLGILPAFSELVGGTFVKRGYNCEIFAIAETSIIKLT
jgi:DNA ligase-associated metallophosphoesterase